MGKVVGAVAMSLAATCASSGWSQPAVMAPPAPAVAGVVPGAPQAGVRVIHEAGAPEPAPVAVGAPVGAAPPPAGSVTSTVQTVQSTTVQLEKGEPALEVAPAVANPTPRGMGVPLYPAPAISAQAGISAPYGQGLAAAAPIGTPYLRSPAFAGPPIIYMPQTVTRVLLPGATPYPSNIMSPPANYVYASAPFIRTDIYTSLPYGTFYWPQGYAGTTPVEPQVPAYVTAPASAIMSTEADFTAGRYQPGIANSETLNPITAGINANLVSSSGVTGTHEGTAATASVSAGGVASASPLTIVPETSVQIESPGVEAAPSAEVAVPGTAVVPAAPVVTPAVVEPFPVLSDAAPIAAPSVSVSTTSTSVVTDGVPALPALPATSVPALPALPATSSAPATGLPALPASTSTPAPGLPALPSASSEVTMALPTLPPESAVAATPASAIPSLPTPATPPAPASAIIVDDKTPGAVTLEPAGDWTPSASTGDSHDGSSIMAKVVAGQPKRATFNATIPADGQYEVALWWVGGAPQFRSPSVPVTINTATGPQQATIDQTKSGQWNVVGVYQLKAGTNVPVVTISTEGMVPAGDAVSVSVDALRLTPQ